MKRLAVFAAITLCAPLLAAATASADNAATTELTRGNTYRYYTACSARLGAQPAQRCPKRGTKGAFFKSVDADVTYKICVRFPSGQRLCASHQSAPQGELQVNTITSHAVGKHKVTWFVAGHRVGTRTLTIHA